MQVSQGIGVATGQGVLIIEEMQLAGKKTMSAGDFARGQRGFVGSRLGGSLTNEDGTPSD
jgi:methionyl-tRNA formyltransferase